MADNKNERLKISLIMPVYNEGDHIETSVPVVIDVIEKCDIDYEMILVDDGSTDDSWRKIEGLSKKDVHIKAIRLSRNFGKEAAIWAALDNAHTDAVLLMDADLQDPPEMIPVFIDEWKKGAEVVEGVKKHRGHESLIYKLCASVFYKVMSKSSGIQLKNASDFKLLDRKVVDAMKLMPERITFFRGMSAWVGFERKQVPFEVKKRVKGKSKWSTKKLIRLAVTSVTSYTTAPLHFITALGWIMLVCAIVLGAQTLIRFCLGMSLEGFTTVILLLLFIGSILMISLGIIGIYLVNIYNETKQRPRYIISKSTFD